MKKRDAFEQEIRKHVDSWCDGNFEWGRADCLLSICDIIKDARGYDPAKIFRGRYSSKIGAFRVTRQFGGFIGAIEEMAIKHHWSEIEPRLAKIGDVGIQRNPRNILCGLIKDVSLWVGRNETAFTAFPTDQIARAWRVK